MGEKSNIGIQIKENDEIKPAGGIYLTDEILAELKNVIGADRINLVEM